MAAKNVKNFEFKLSKNGLVVLIGGMAFLLCVAFLFGVEVGKNLDAYPEKISAFPYKVFSLLSRPFSLNPDKPDKTGEDLSKAPEETKKDDVAEISPQSEEKKISEQKEITKEKEEKQSSLSEEEQNLLTKPDVRIDKKSTKTADAYNQAPKAIKNQYLVHVASFQQKGKAYILNKKITQLGYTPKVIPVEIRNRGIWYRVVVSGFDNKEKATKAAQHIAQKTSTHCVVQAAPRVNP